MFDDKSVKERIEKRLENEKQWEDEFGIVWCEVNGKKVPKNQLIEACMENEQLEMLKEKCNFLPY